MNYAPDTTDEVIDSIAQGDILPVEALGRYPLPEQELGSADTDVNVLLDLAHHCYMGAMWGLTRQMKALGFRCVSTHACLDKVLTPGAPVTVRTLAGELADGKKVRPFIHWPNADYNVVVTLQADGKAPAYTDDELTALDAFVSDGGGLVMIADINAKGTFPPWGEYADWPLRQLAQAYGADISSEGARVGKTLAGDSALGIVPIGEDAKGRAASADGSSIDSATVPALELNDDAWETVLSGEDGEPIVACRAYGKGRVVAVSSLWLIHHPLWTGLDETPEMSTERDTRLREILSWASEGKAPVSGDTRLPDTHGGAGGIYPEKVTRIDSIHIYYASNQPASVLKIIEDEYPKIRERILQWLPSPIPEGEPLRILLGAGIGGGWAVNAFYPKENGIISYELAGIVGIFAHELAHILSGPRNADGDVAGHWFDGNQGEAHAGFFQGRILAEYTDNKSMRGCDDTFEYEKKNGPIDFVAISDSGSRNYRGSHVWRKLWYVWQKLDERYGTTWYPRWRWVQHTRWADDPERQLTFEEMTEDMSLAVGEDLFPFLKKAKCSMSRECVGPIKFNGMTHELPEAPLDYTPTGNACLEPAGDYRQPINTEK